MLLTCVICLDLTVCLLGTIVNKNNALEKILQNQRNHEVCDEMRLSVEFVTVGFLGICRQYWCDRFPVSWRADELRLKGALR